MSKYTIISNRYMKLRKSLMLKWNIGKIKTHRFLNTGNKLFIREQAEKRMALNSLLTK